MPHKCNLCRQSTHSNRAQAAEKRGIELEIEKQQPKKERGKGYGPFY